MPSSPAAPVLANGDRLTRDEFERRYEAMPKVKKAELIEGTVYMPSPVHASDLARRLCCRHAPRLSRRQRHGSP
jgi:hypothetical protein